MDNKTTRRSFLKVSALAGAASALSPASVMASAVPGDMIEDKTKGLVFLFQGDSITDGNRGRDKDPNHIMGHGYAFSVASRIGADFAESNPVFYNRGISGNRVTDLEKRWQTDGLDIKPDVLSILVGINDGAVMIKEPEVKEATIDQFENSYRIILAKSKQQNPDTLFVLCLPFVYPVGRVKDDWEKYRSTVDQLAGRIRKLAAEFNSVLVDFPAVFDKAIKRKPAEYWIWDGIHPTVPAHELMAREWIKQVGVRLKFLEKYK
ncbi:SGNH/GDSL hydrolase family protein [Terrimonas pollutisoli]|uniref:SGNH/GDSL hydrolase family protein n=1 Tax=Terrimonas pollutisoli TaxID=3034147 RepID=UPI0023ED6D59|nr:SGNH/GDSL hydrolase family protein [Terrimonas sp. H1YJ31]